MKLANDCRIETLESRFLLSAVSFGPQQTFGTGDAPRFVAVGDLNGDGKQDLVVANKYSQSVSILLGNGNGTFQAQQTLAAGNEPASVAVAELTGDGHEDLIVG